MNADEFVKQALEATIYYSPRDQGLSYEELTALGETFGFNVGAINQAMQGVVDGRASTDDRLVANKNHIIGSMTMAINEPDPRNRAAFRATLQEMKDHALKNGNRTPLPHDNLVALVSQKGHQAHHVEVAIACLGVSGPLELTDRGVVAAASLIAADVDNFFPLRPALVRHPEGRAEILQAVERLVQARTTGGRKSTDPLRAFADYLATAGPKHVHTWWLNAMSESAVLVPSSTPTATAVIFGALAELALIYCVGFSRARGLSPFRADSWNKEPTAFKLAELLRGAATGQSDTILDPHLQQSALALCDHRNLIHGGRYFSGKEAMPDFKVASAESMKNTAKLVVDRVLDWLTKYEAHSNALTGSNPAGS